MMRLSLFTAGLVEHGRRGAVVAPNALALITPYGIVTLRRPLPPRSLILGPPKGQGPEGRLRAEGVLTSLCMATWDSSLISVVGRRAGAPNTSTFAWNSF